MIVWYFFQKLLRFLSGVPFAQRLKGYVRVIAIKWGKLLQRYVIPKSEIILTVPQKHGILSETSSVATIMYCIGAWVSEVARLRILRKTKISRHIFQPGVKTRVHQNTIPIIITRISLEPSEIAVNIPALNVACSSPSIVFHSVYSVSNRDWPTCVLLNFHRVPLRTIF